MDGPFLAQLAANVLQGRLKETDNDLKNVKYENIDYFGISGQYWACFYEHIATNLLPDVGKKFLPDILKIKRLFEVGVAGAITFENAIIVWRRPKYATYDEQNRPHNANGPSVLWQDGFAQWAWHGVDMRTATWAFITKDLIEKPKESAQRILTEPNTEVRRALAEMMGMDRFLSELNPEILDEDTFEVDTVVESENGFSNKKIGHKYRLLKVKFPDYEDLVMLEGSTIHGKMFLEGVPPTIKNCREAEAWRRGVDVKDYNPKLVSY